MVARAGAGPRGGRRGLSRPLVRGSRRSRRAPSEWPPIGRDRETGSLEPGKLAEFVIVRGDPTEDMSHVRQIEAVFLAGSWPRVAVSSPGTGADAVAA
jgi:hypothetical protein